MPTPTPTSGWPTTRRDFVIGARYRLPYHTSDPNARTILRTGDVFSYDYYSPNQLITFIASPDRFSPVNSNGRSYSGDASDITLISLAPDPENPPMPTTLPSTVPVTTPAPTDLPPLRPLLTVGVRRDRIPSFQQRDYFITGDRIRYHRPTHGDIERVYDRVRNKWSNYGSSATASYICNQYPLTVTFLNDPSAVTTPTSTPQTPGAIRLVPIIQTPWNIPAAPPTPQDIERAVDILLRDVWSAQPSAAIARPTEFSRACELLLQFQTFITRDVRGGHVHAAPNETLTQTVSRLNSLTSDLYHYINTFAGNVCVSIPRHSFAPPPRDRLLQQVTELAAQPNARITDTEITFTTLPIVLEGRNFGRFLVTLNYQHMQRMMLATASFNLTPLEPYYARVAGSASHATNYPHPNVNTGKLCFGDADLTVCNLLGNGYLAAASYYIETCLATGYRDRGPFQRYYMWPIARQPNPVPEGSPPPTHRDALYAFPYLHPDQLIVGSSAVPLTTLDPESGCPLPPTPRPQTDPPPTTTPTSGSQPIIPPSASTPGPWNGPPPEGVYPAGYILPTNPGEWRTCSISGNVFNPRTHPANGGLTDEGDYLCVTHGYFCTACNHWHPR